MISYAYAASTQPTEAASLILGLGIIVFVIAIYFLPTILAASRKLASAGGLLFVVNLLLGWTLIGWAVCLLWAALGQTQAQAAFFEREARR